MYPAYGYHAIRYSDAVPVLIGFQLLAIVPEPLDIRPILRYRGQFFAVCQCGDLGFCYFVVHCHCFTFLFHHKYTHILIKTKYFKNNLQI